MLFVKPPLSFFVFSYVQIFCSAPASSLCIRSTVVIIDVYRSSPPFKALSID